MITIDLLKTRRHALAKILEKEVGYVGKKLTLTGSSAGLGGFIFEDRVGDSTIVYKANFQKFSNGIGVYCRSRHYNFLVLFPFTTIQKIEVIKNHDLLAKHSFSWFSGLLRLGFNYDLARPFILEQEWIKKEDLYVVIKTIQNVEFRIKSFTPRSQKLHTFFNSLSEDIPLQMNINSFKFKSPY